MLALDDPRWAELSHAYGRALDTPALLRQLESLPRSGDRAEPWFTIWSSLAHQGDVYSASFAAVPHVVRILATAPEAADSAFFHFPAWIEVCRQRKRMSVPEQLAPSYFSALSKLPSLVAAAASQPWDEERLVCALSAVAAAKGYGTVAEAILELVPGTSEAFLKWLSNR